MSNRLLHHVLFWIAIFFVWTFMKSGRFTETDELLIGVINTISYAMVYYGLSRLLIAQYFDKGKMIHFGISIILLSIISISLWSLMITGLSKLIETPPTILPSPKGAYVLEGIQLYVPGFILLAWESFTIQQKEEERLHLLEKENITNELNYLKAKINPSFLLDTLDSLKEHIKTSSPEAPKMILRLSGILDYILYKSQNKTTSIEEEMKVIESFVKLTSLQGNTNIEVNFNIEGILSKRISPLGLLSTVEQVFKAIKMNMVNTIEIALLSTEYKLDFKIKVASNNTLDINSDELKVIERQLSLSYPEKHALKINTTASEIYLLFILNHQHG